VKTLLLLKLEKDGINLDPLDEIKSSTSEEEVFMEDSEGF